MKRLIRVVSAILLAAAALGQSDYAMQTEHFRVLYPEGRYDKAEVVAQAAEDALGPLSASLDVQLPGVITVRLFNTRTEMFATIGSKPQPYVMGLALPETNRILLGIVGDESLARTTAHELAHIMLFAKFGSEMPADQPRWLHEGIAQFAAGKLTEDQQRVLGEVAVSGELLSIAEMERAFSGDSQQVALAYAQALTLTQYLHQLRPQGGIAALVANLTTTGDLNRALIRTYGMTQAAIEAEWLTQTRARYLSAGIPLSSELLVWAAMGLLFIVAIVVQTRRRAAIRRRLQEEEALRQPLGR